MSDQNTATLGLPDWYLVERQTQKTIMKLSSLKELDFYLNHPDEFIRHQAILRLGQLRLKESVQILAQMMDDPLEKPLNREIAAWVLKSTGLYGKNDYYIGNQYLDLFNGDEKLKDFYYPKFLESRKTLDYHFGASRIKPLLNNETIVVKAEAIEEKADLHFSMQEWLTHFFSNKLNKVKQGYTAIQKQGLPALIGMVKKALQKKQSIEDRGAKKSEAGLKHQIEQNEPEKPTINANITNYSDTQDAKKPEAGLRHQTERNEAEKPAIVGNITNYNDIRDCIGNENQTQEMRMDANPSGVEQKLSTVKTEDIAHFEEYQPTYKTAYIHPVENVKKQEPYIQMDIHAPLIGLNDQKSFSRPFALQSDTDEKIRKQGERLAQKGRIYVRANTWKITAGDWAKGVLRKAFRVLLFPFIILWNQKVVILIVFVSLYLFFSFVPYGRMLFYKKQPELAQMNDSAIETAGIWFSEKINDIKEKAVEYQLVRDIQKKLLTDEENEKSIEESDKYIVTAQKLNLRKDPGTSGEKLMTLSHNTVVEFLNRSIQVENSGLWLYIKAPDGTMGWSHADWLKKIEIGKEAYEGS